MGITVCVASGDNGSSDGVTDGADHVDSRRRARTRWLVAARTSNRRQYDHRRNGLERWRKAARAAAASADFSRCRHGRMGCR